MSADIFVSYASKDRDRVLPLVERLQELGVSTWIDRAGIDPSSFWFQMIVEAIEQCRLILLVASTHSFASRNVLRELSLGLTRDKPILPVYLEPAKIPREMEYALTGVQHVELFGGPMDEGFAGIVRALTRHGVAMSEASGGPDRSEAFSVDQALDGLGYSPFILPREQLLNEAARKLQEGPSPFLVLQGLAGIGKTVLMTRVARASHSAGDLILAIPLDGPSALEPAYLLELLDDFLTRLRRGVRPEQLTGDKPERVLAVLGAQLAELGVRVLVLLDAVDAVVPSWLEALLRCLAKPPLVRLMATTRTRINGLESAHMVVPPLSDSEAIALVAEYRRLFKLEIDPEDLIRRLPPGIRSHPQALVALLAQLADFPLDVLLAWGLPDPVQTPARLVEKIVSALAPLERRALALMQMLSGLELLQAATLLRLNPGPNFLAALKSLLARSLLYRSSDAVYVVPALVAETLVAVDEAAINEAAEQVAAAWRTVVSAPGSGDATVLAHHGVQIVHNLAVARRWSLVRDSTPEDFLECLNLRGLWKEYAVLLRLGLDAARKLEDRNCLVRLGLRLTRKLVQTGDADSARELLREVEPLVARAETQQRGELHSHRAMICQLDREDDGMLRELRESHRIRTALGDRAGLAVVEKQLGNLHLRQGDLAAARQSFTAARDLLADQPLSKHRLEAAINLAVCDLKQGKLEEAEKSLRQTLADCLAGGYEAGMPRAQLNLALVLERQDRLREALELARQAARDAEEKDFAVARSATLVAGRLDGLLGGPVGKKQ